VEDERNEIMYSVLEPTLTEADKKSLEDIKNILWDELTASTKDFKQKQEIDEFLSLRSWKRQ